MYGICLIIVGVWLIGKLLSGPSSSNKNGGFSNIEKYKTFESFRKRGK